nr:hypothetical protein [Tanacetum cinerariifolium]GEX28658.1 hypothetical protein [Tanacetum cinerariifolium]
MRSEQSNEGLIGKRFGYKKQEYSRKQADNKGNRTNKNMANNAGNRKQWLLQHKEFEAIKKTINKFSILETIPKDDPMEMNMLKDMMIEEDRKKEAEENTQKVDNIGSEEDDIFIKENVMNEVKDVCEMVFGSWEWVTNSQFSTNSYRIMLSWNPLTVKIRVIHDLKDCINLVEVEDIGSCGFFYTCIKNLRNLENSIFKKIDRVIVSERFLMEFEGSHANFKPFMVSDHSHTLLVIPSCCTKKPKSFRFANYTADKPEFINEVTKGCKIKVKGHMMYSVIKKLKQMNPLMNKLNLKHEDLTVRAELLRVKLQEVQALVEKDPYNNQIKTKAIEILDEYNENSKARWIHFLIFKRAWNVIGNDVCAAIREFFITGQMLGELNATLMTLVPKIQSPNKVSNFRPIACCNVLYKCISKVITNRIKGALKKLVQINQSTFIHNRLIQDNILLSQEILRGYGRKNDAKRYAMKIDLQKAYDIRKIRNCRDFKYHHGCKELKLVNLCFADVLMIFCHGDTTSAGLIKEALREFSEVSGLFPNLNKITLFFGCLNHIEKENINNVMQFKEGSLPAKYLRVPLITKRLSELRDKVADRLQYEVGDGSNIYMWYDKWQNNGMLIDQVSNRDLYDARMPKMIKLSDMIDEGVWKWPSEWRNDELEVMNIEVPRQKNGVHDKVKWKCVDNSLMPFHTKLVMDDFSPNLERINSHVLVWFKQCIPKHALCLWLAMLGRLQTQDKIMTWGT